MKTLDQEWENFVAHVYPEKISENQMQEMKRCFYSGALVSIKQTIERANQNGSDGIQELIKEAEIVLRAIMAHDMTPPEKDDDFQFN